MEICNSYENYDDNGGLYGLKFVHVNVKLFLLFLSCVSPFLVMYMYLKFVILCFSTFQVECVWHCVTLLRALAAVELKNYNAILASPIY